MVKSNTNQGQKMNTIENTNEQAFIDAIKVAHARRDELFERGEWTREEMLAANAAIIEATERWHRCCC
jgi:ribosomal 50S subunit-associated protein YjgA (DUF615 family)